MCQAKVHPTIFCHTLCANQFACLSLFMLNACFFLQLLVHIACVALHIDDFKCPFESLCQDTGVFAEELKEKFRLLGCTVSRNVAKMKLPIVWPVTRKRARA
jgi:hypothetical protein